MKVRLLTTKEAGRYINSSAGPPAVQIHIWPAELMVPEGYEELEIVGAAPQVEPYATASLNLEREVVGKMLCDHRTGFVYDIEGTTVFVNANDPEGWIDESFSFCPDCGAKLLQPAGG